MRILGFLRARCGREHDAMMPARDLAVDPRGRHWVLPVSTGATSRAIQRQPQALPPVYHQGP